MSNKSYNRGSQVISSQIAADRKRRENLAARNYQAVLSANQETIETQKARIEQLEAELKKAKLYVELRKAERDATREELANTQVVLERTKADRNSWRDACLTVEKKHKKLSGIVRLALSSEEYHRYREIYEDS